MSKHMYSTANLTDKELKEQGNRLFSLRKYDDAINCYSKAIIKNPDIPHYFTNRALCHLKLMRWDQACVDCRRALDMDPSLVKGHFFMGQALFETDCFDEAIKHLLRAQDLAKEQKLNFGDDIAALLRAARKMRFSLQEEKRIAQEIELQTYLNKLIQEDKEKQISKLHKECDGDTKLEKIAEIEESCSVASDLAEEAVTGEQDLLLPIGLRCRIKYPNKIPVYIHKTPRCTINDLDKRRYLVPSEMTIGQFFSLIRRRISVRPEQGVFFLVAGAHIPSITSTMGEVYREHSENYMLHITYSEESAYGR